LGPIPERAIRRSGGGEPVIGSTPSLVGIQRAAPTPRHSP
jgi:hypothetical protein